MRGNGVLGVLSVYAIAGVVMIAGCGGDDLAEDPQDEAVMVEDKADAFGFKEGSPEASGILRVANDLSQVELKSQALITSQAARWIVKERPFATLVALDAVPFVGKKTFQRLLAYAQAQGWVTPADLGAAPDLASSPDLSTSPDLATPSVPIFDDQWLSGTPITQAEAVARFSPGNSSATVGSWGMAMRTRACNSTTGCGGWTYRSNIQLAWMTYDLWLPGPGWSPQKSCWQFETADFSSIGGTASFAINNSAIDLKLDGATIGSSRCAGITGAKSTCTRFETTSVAVSGGSACYLPNRSGSGKEPAAYPVSVTLYSTTQTEGQPLTFSLLTTSQWAYGRSSTKSKPDASGNYRVVEYALFVSLDGRPIPTP